MVVCVDWLDLNGWSAGLAEVEWDDRRWEDGGWVVQRRESFALCESLFPVASPAALLADRLFPRKCGFDGIAEVTTELAVDLGSSLGDSRGGGGILHLESEL